HTRDDPADVLDPVHPVVLSVSAFFSLLPHPPSSTLFPYTTLFRSDQLDAAVHVHGTMIPGSSGQLVVNPAIAEARQQRAAAWAILKGLMPTESDTDAASMGQADSGHAVRSVASQRAAHAASVRWERARAAREMA